MGNKYAKKKPTGFLYAGIGLAIVIIIAVVFLRGRGHAEPAEPKILPSVTEIQTFQTVEDAEICTEEGKPVIRLFSTTWCPHCKWVKPIIDPVFKEYVAAGSIVAYHWDVDISDNTLTKGNDGSIPDGEHQVFRDFNPRGSVPTYVFGCKYWRIGNGYESQDDLLMEEAEIRFMIDQVISETNTP